MYENMTKYNRAILMAINRGFELRNGIMYSSTGNKLNPIKHKNGYLYVSIRPKMSDSGKREVLSVYIHKFVAYLKSIP